MSLSAIPDLGLNAKGEESATIKDHLEGVLSSAPFRHSQRSQAFLRYIVQEALEGRGEQIKERNIGVDVFGKAEDFDPQEESLVRVCAGEVRKRLAHVYESGFHDGVRIELPLGSYTPRFNVDASSAPLSQTLAAVPAPIQDAGIDHSRSRKLWILIPLLAVLCCCAAAGSYFYLLRSRDPLDLLWQSFAHHREAVLIVLPAPTVLQPKHANDLKSELESGRLSPDEFDVREDYFTGVGASLGAARFAEQLALRHQPFLIKFGVDASFPDLSAEPTILLGGFTSRLGQSVMQHMRYQLIGGDQYLGIVDTTVKDRIWKIPSHPPEGKTDQGYALVTILHNSDFKQPILLVAGLSAIDTASAVDFLTDEEYFKQFSQKAPGDWYKKNCQIVIYNREYGSSPGRPELIAWYVW